MILLDTDVLGRMTDSTDPQCTAKSPSCSNHTAPPFGRYDVPGHFFGDLL